MVQRFVSLILLCLVLVPTAEAAETGPASPGNVPAQKKLQKTAEELYLDGLTSLNAEDVGSAGVILAGLNPVSPYAKLLRAQIAAAGSDFETPLRLLIPLQAETGLIPQAYASLHATLSLAYEAQDNILNALEQRTRAEPFLEEAAAKDNQVKLWNLLSSRSRDVLVEMRGESSDPIVQGWIDLALAVSFSDQKSSGIEQWRGAYPDHPAGAGLLEQLSDRAPQLQTADGPVISGKIALLLPFDNPAFAAAAGVVRAGILAAMAAGAGRPEVVSYSTGGEVSVTGLYRQAVEEGATFVIGPLTRDEVTQLASEPLTVPVLALNQPDGAFRSQSNLSLFGLPVEAEARQVARLARSHGMQTALIVAADTPLAERMTKAFSDEWKSRDGTIVAQMTLPALDGRADFKAEAAKKTADMIFLAANAAQAQDIRPWLDPAVPTYGTSHVYDGMAKSILNLDLLAVRFVDLPWMIDPENPEYATLRPSEPLVGAEQQRLYALGLDAYRLVGLLAEGVTVDRPLMDGATGHIIMREGNILVRELMSAQFRREGVVAEPEN